MQMEKFIRHRLVVCKWVGLGALIIQVCLPLPGVCVCARM